MSAAKEFMNDGKSKFGLLINILLIFIGAMTTSWFSTRDFNERELTKTINNKVDIEQFNKIEQLIPAFASRDYVNEKISEHEKTDAARYQGIKDMFELIIEEQGEIKRDIKEILKSQK